MIQLSSASSSIRLPNPELGDSLNLITNVKTKRVMDGSFYTYRNSVIKRRTLTFKSLTVRKMLELKEFLETTSGEVLTYIDYNSVEHICLLLTQPNDIVAESRGRGIEDRKEAHTITLELEEIE